jgi:hypothetical protein
MAPRSRAKAVDTDASMSDAQEHRQEEEMVSCLLHQIFIRLWVRAYADGLFRKLTRPPTTLIPRTLAPLPAASPESLLGMAVGAAQKSTNFVAAFLERSTIDWANPRFVAL